MSRGGSWLRAQDPSAGGEGALAVATMDKPRARQLLQGLVPASEHHMRRCIDLLRDSGLSASPPPPPARARNPHIQLIFPA